MIAISLLHPAVLLSVLGAASASVADYRALDRVALPGNDGWDYAATDADARRLYVTHGTVVHVLDLDSLKPVGALTPLGNAHGVALAPALGRGFVSDGKADAVVVFDLKTLAVTASWPSGGKNPDAVLYDGFSGRVFAFNGGSKDATAFDAATGKAAGTLALGGQPEFAVGDGAGAIFVNIEDTDETVRFDARTLAITARWPLAPGATPTALGLDVAGHRLFAGCRSGHLVVLDSRTGARVADLPIGTGVDAITFDPKGGKIFVSNGDGTLTVVSQLSPDRYEVAATVQTPPGTKTHARDARTGRLFLPGAKLIPAPAPAAGEKPARPQRVPDTFSVLVLAPQ